MKKGTKFIIVLASFIAVIAVFTVTKVIQSKEYYSHPVYYTYDKENNHKSFVMVDGIEYKAGCALDSNQMGDMIGFLDDKSCPIYRIKDDINKNFLYVTPPSEFRGAYQGYYRSDFVFPETSADTINKFNWWDSTCRSTKTITDPYIINELLEILNNKQNNIITGEKAVTWAEIDFCFKDTPGLISNVSICVWENGNFYCAFFDKGNVMKMKISKDLLERIAGHRLNVDKEIENLRKYKNAM